MYCTRCGHQLPQECKFCPNCGSPVEVQTPPDGTGWESDSGQIREYTAASGASREVPKRTGSLNLVLKILALCAELCLICGLVSCGDREITGIDAIRGLFENWTDAMDWEARLGLLLCSIGAMLIFFISFLKARTFVVNMVLSFLSFCGVMAMFVYYRFVADYAEVIYGAYLILTTYLFMFIICIAGFISERKNR